MLSIHEPYFVLPGGTKSPFFQLKSSVDQVIIQDPYFGFDFEEYQVCKEEYCFHSPHRTFISDFIDSCERNAGLNEDEILWRSDGYWSIKNGKDLYIGLGVEALDLTLPMIHSGILVFCLYNIDFCVFIKIRIDDCVFTLIKIAIYASTVIRPWIEILEPFRKTMPEIASNQITKKVLIQPIIVSNSFQIYGQEGLVFPYAISPTEQGWIGPSIIQNHFGPFGVDRLFTQAHGGWLKKDFFKPSKYFFFSGEQHFFDDVIVIRGMVVLPFKYEKVAPVFTKELKEYRNLVELFPE